MDYVEETGGQLYGFEFKWSNTKAHAPKTWIENYPTATYRSVSKSNFMQFVRFAGVEK